MGLKETTAGIHDVCKLSKTEAKMIKEKVRKMLHRPLRNTISLTQEAVNQEKIFHNIVIININILPRSNTS